VSVCFDAVLPKNNVPDVQRSFKIVYFYAVPIRPADVKIDCRLFFRHWPKTKTSIALSRRRHQCRSA